MSLNRLRLSGKICIRLFKQKLSPFQYQNNGLNKSTLNVIKFDVTYGLIILYYGTKKDSSSFRFIQLFHVLC